MRLLLKIALAIGGNAAGLLLASRYIPGFQVTYDWRELLLLALALAILNALLRPLLKLLLGPLIVLTLGLGIILVNALILTLLDFLAPSLTIQGIAALAEGTLFLAALNFVINLFTP